MCQICCLPPSTVPQENKYKYPNAVSLFQWYITYLFMSSCSKFFFNFFPPSPSLSPLLSLFFAFLCFFFFSPWTKQIIKHEPKRHVPSQFIVSHFFEFHRIPSPHIQSRSIVSYFSLFHCIPWFHHIVFHLIPPPHISSHPMIPFHPISLYPMIPSHSILP